MPEAPARVLVVDDQEAICRSVAAALQKEGYDLHTFSDPREALVHFQEHGADVVVQDLVMPQMPGLEFLRAVKDVDPNVIVIVVTAHDTWDSTVEAMRLGAYNYLKKPFDNEGLRSTIARALELRRLARESADESRLLEQVIGDSKAMLDIESMIRRVSPTDSTILITGDHGTGKERLARAIHHLSLRKHHPFVPLNCGGLSESLLESELFGHTRGSFTGAVEDRLGYFETAAGGTLFMDEVGEMPLATQVKVLRVLEDRSVIRVGASEGRKVNVRIIAATNRDLDAAVKAGTFRADLLYRLNVIPIHLPSLADRREDIPALAGRFLATYGQRLGKPVCRFTTDAMQYMTSREWPGNIRELQNTIERAVALTEGEEVTLSAVQGVFVDRHQTERIALLGEIPPEGFDLERELGRVERSYIELALARTRGRQKEAATLLGMTARSLRYKIKKYGITRDAEVDESDNS